MGSRLAVFLVAASMMAGACSGGGDGDDVSAVPQTTTTVSDGAPTTDAGGAPGPAETTPAGPAGPGPSPTAPPANGAPSGPAPTTTTAPVPAPGGVGGYAAFYLRPSESSTVVLDVHSQAGAEPTGETLAHVQATLRDVSGKEVGLNGGTVDGGARSWTAADIRALADRIGLDQSRQRAVITFLYLRGGFADSDTVLGVAVRSDVVAIFSDRVREASGPLTSSTRVETAVSTHELGHLLGLVDLVLDTGRDDPEHPGHSTNRGSVMFWAVESTLVGSLLEGGPPTTFDAADRADIAAIRNG